MVGPQLLAGALALLLAGGLGAQPIRSELLVLQTSRPSAGKVVTESSVHAQELAPGILWLKYANEEVADAGLRALRKRYPHWHYGYNYRVSSRTVPDDPEYFRQQNMVRAGFEAAWDVTTGGRAADGHAIVVAILDDGFDATHPDLIDNLWHNTAEIPADGRDNDGNGYVDDLQGWNFVDDQPVHPTATHGTSVAGLIGASGNNGIGVAGTNWNLQMMPFTINTVADIIAAYQYVIDQRTLYNTTGGQRGAFVVATNASFGVEGATCADFPAWGAMYDRLGTAGVLTAASVVNLGRDVDSEGDMPVTCPSEAIIGVTNLGQDDLRFPSAGYGRVHVDLAAPGEESFTTRPNGRYGSFGSTSAAAPYVTGAIALLYASPDCPTLARAARQDPAATAARIRRALLSSVRSIASLANTTATGGTLDVAGAQQSLLSTCADPEAPFTLNALWPVPAAGSLTVATGGQPLGETVTAQVTDALGRLYAPLPVTLLSDDQLRIGLTALPAGFYYLRVTNGSDTAGTKILVTDQ